MIVFRREIRYLCSGVSAALVNLSILYILTDLLEIWYLISSVLALTVAIFVSFLLQKFWTFNDSCCRRIKKQFFIFYGVVICNLVVNIILMKLLVERFYLHYMIAQIFSGGFIAIYTFIFYRRIFVSPDRKSTEVPL